MDRSEFKKMQECIPIQKHLPNAPRLWEKLVKWLVSVAKPKTKGHMWEPVEC